MKTNTCILNSFAVSVCEDYLLNIGAGKQLQLAQIVSLAEFNEFSKAHDTWNSNCTDWFETKANLALFLLEAHDSELAEMEQEAADAELERQLFH